MEMFIFQCSILNLQIPNFLILTFPIPNFQIPNFQILNFQIPNIKFQIFKLRIFTSTSRNTGQFHVTLFSTTIRFAVVEKIVYDGIFTFWYINEKYFQLIIHFRFFWGPWSELLGLPSSICWSVYQNIVKNCQKNRKIAPKLR